MSVESAPIASIVESLSAKFEAGENPFAQRYANCPDSEWLGALIASIGRVTDQGPIFPFFPATVLQERIHGHSNENSIKEAFAFFLRVKEIYIAQGGRLDQDARLLDFGSGWGRIVRPFMRDLSLANIVGYEPNPWFCAVARDLNPYVTFFNGPFYPPMIFAENFFNLVVSWSVFSHLPVRLAEDWLADFHRILKPGSLVFFTTWGARFLDRLVGDAVQLDAGKPVHFYSEIVIKAAKDLQNVKERYHSGEYVFLDSQGNGRYGEAFVPVEALKKIIKGRFDVVLFDDFSLPQDLYVLKKMA